MPSSAAHASSRGCCSCARNPLSQRQAWRPAPRSSSAADGRRGGAVCPSLRRLSSRPSSWKTRRPSTYAAAGVVPIAEVTEFDFDSYMTERAMLVEVALSEACPASYPETVTEAMRYSLLAGGKRVRPVLCLAASEAVGGKIEDALPTAVAMEMIHTMSLIHDDLPAMDNDDFRRGKPTCHKKYGEDIAILAGDAMLSSSFGHIAAATPESVPRERVVRVIVDLSRAVGQDGLVGGQIVDLECEGKPPGEVTVETLKYIHEHKTAALLEASVVCGAVVGGASEDDVEALRRYALDIGLAFQVVDDILDVTKSTEELGKTAGKDLTANKATYPSLVGLERSKEIASELIENAKRQLERFDERKAAPLRALADFIGARNN